MTPPMWLLRVLSVLAGIIGALAAMIGQWWLVAGMAGTVVAMILAARAHQER